MNQQRTMAARRVRGVGLLAAVTALLALAVPGSSRADTVTDWNVHATDALIEKSGQVPTVALVNLAMVHGAVYDAANAIDRRYQPYLAAPRPAKRSYSKGAAAATAAYRVLADVVPEQRAALQPLYAASLARLPAGVRAKDGGIAVGEGAAAAMLRARANDGRFGPFRFPVGAGPGQWRPVPPIPINDPFAWVARVRPFLIRSPSQFRTRGPNPLTSAAYAKDLAEVSSLGSLALSARTADQTDMAVYWVGDVALWNRIFLGLAADRGLKIADNARFFAMLYMTAADAAIGCWDDKAHWLFWRPLTAIQNADTDGNPATEADPAWRPLLPTPPFPEHPSGHACASGSFVATLRDFFGTDKARFSARSPVSGTTRSFKRFSQAIEEVIDARVYAGVHFRTADLQGARLGRKVARWRQRHYFQRVRRER
jgi:hypothetical protein